MRSYQITITSTTSLVGSSRGDDCYRCYSGFEIFYLLVIFIANVITAVSLPLPWYWIGDVHNFYVLFIPASNYYMVIKL